MTKTQLEALKKYIDMAITYELDYIANGSSGSRHWQEMHKADSELDNAFIDPYEEIERLKRLLADSRRNEDRTVPTIKQDMGQ